MENKFYMENTLQAKKNVIISLIVKIFDILMPFFVRTIIIKKLGSEYLGLNSLFTSILQVLSLAELGISSAIVFCLYKPISDNDNTLICAFYNWLRKIYKIIGIVILVVGLVLMPFIKYLISGDIPNDISIYMLYSIYLFNTVISYFLFAYQNTLLTAFQRVDKIAMVNFFSNIFMYVFQIIVLFLYKNYYFYIVFLPISTIVKNISIHFVVKKYFKEIIPIGDISSKQKKEVSKMLAGLISYKVGGVFRNSFDSIAISSILGLTTLGIYNNYYYILTAVSGIIVVIINAILPTIGHSVVKNSVKYNYSLLNKLTYIFEFLGVITSCCLISLYQPFIKIWLGNEYLLDDISMIFMVVYYFVLILSEATFIFRQATGIWWNDKFRPLVESIVNLILNFSLVYFFGVVGVILGTIISVLFITIPWGTKVLFNNYFKINEKEYLLKLYFSFFLSLIIIIGCYFIYKLFTIQNVIVELVVNGAIAVIYSIICFILFHIFDNRQKESLKYVFSLFFRKKDKSNEN